jgi:Putative transposase
MTHHPHLHMIVPGGGVSLDRRRWISSRPAFLLPVRVLGALFRRLFLTWLMELHDAGKLAFFGAQADLADRRRFLRHLAPLRNKRWVVYARAPFAGPEAVLAYLSRYTHRVAISNRRLIAFDKGNVTFRYKAYRRSGPQRQQVMTLDVNEFMRRFLLHVLPRGFHRIRHYGLFASAARKANIARVRELLAVSQPPKPIEALSPLISFHPVLVAAGACASSRPSSAGRGRAPRPAPPKQPGAPSRPGTARSFLVEATPLQRMNECAPYQSRGATGGPIFHAQAMIQRQSARISDRSSHARTHRGVESARALAGQILKYP